MINRILHVLFLAQMLFLCLNSWAQSSKRYIESRDFLLWERLGMMTTNTKGTHLYYLIQRGENEQIHRIKSLSEEVEREYTNISNGRFIDYQERFVYITKSDTLVVESISGKKVFQIDSVSAIHVLSEGRFLILSDKNWYSPEVKNVRILDISNGITKSIPNVWTVTVSPNQKFAAFAMESSKGRIVKIFDPIEPDISLEVPLPGNHMPVNLNWTEDSQSISFVLQQDGKKELTDTIGLLLDIHRNESFEWLDLGTITGWDGSYQMVSHNRSYPMISLDKQRVFLSASMQSTSIPSILPVEIWNSNAKWLYPYKKSGDVASWGKLGVIDLKKERFTSLTHSHEVEGTRGLDDQFVLHLDRNKYLPTYKFNGDFFDLRISSTDGMSDNIVETKIRDQGGRVLFVDKLNSVAYYHQENWYLYNPIDKKKINITRNISQVISECSNCNKGFAYGGLDPHFYVFDEQNLWQIDPNGNNPKQLTGLHTYDIEFRFNTYVYGYGKSHQILEVDPIGGIYLEGVNRRTGETGFFKWSERNGLETIVYGNKKVQFLRVLPNKNGYMYTQQTFEKSPEIIWKKSLTKPEKTIVRTNTQQLGYHWGKSEMVHYRSSRTYKTSGRELHGALFYPANYDPNKKYPLIVSIYEDNSYTLHEYQNPGINRFIDFNPTDYTLDGYFVLQPSLLPREPSNPGHSMMINLQAAVDYMKSTGMIDPNRIGLYGHSFGGYEALFAATQIHDFATIIAGAPISDLVTDYFTHRPLLRGPSFYRSETQQFNMHKSYFEIPEMYEANSPFRYIQNVTTPLLIWAGKSDVNVGVEQSIQFYLGMLRLEKECTLILYPDEDHVLAKPENLTDLDTRMKQWFNHYLKDGPKEDWMESR